MPGPSSARTASPAARGATVDAVMRAYHDTEWGMPVARRGGPPRAADAGGVPVRAVLATILHKRPAFREAFAGFDADRDRGVRRADVARLMADAGIVRNRAKVNAAITNARATVALRDARRSRGADRVVPPRRPARTPRPPRRCRRPTESLALSKALKKPGFAFVGPDHDVSR